MPKFLSAEILSDKVGDMRNRTAPAGKQGAIFTNKKFMYLEDYYTFTGNPADPSEGLKSFFCKKKLFKGN